MRVLDNLPFLPFNITREYNDTNKDSLVIVEVQKDNEFAKERTILEESSNDFRKLLSKYLYFTLFFFSIAQDAAISGC